MILFPVRNVHCALPAVLDAINNMGIPRKSRNGDVLQFPAPVAVCYSKPTERVMFWPERDANPFLHFFESLWMIAGRNDVAFLSQFSKQIPEYSDDGVTFRGAYGFRWKEMFGFDQLEMIIHALRSNPDDRRQVIQMWDAGIDLGKVSKDLPCNLTITVQINPVGELDIVVLQRSGDIVWGVLGANAVHFPFLQEYLAASIGVPVGSYWQVVHNAHVYINDQYERIRPIALAAPDGYRHNKRASQSPYQVAPIEVGLVQPYPLFAGTSEKESWDLDLKDFFNWVGGGDGFLDLFRTKFFNRVVQPMYRAHRLFKVNSIDYESVYRCVGRIEATDWQLACREWIGRREEKRKSKVVVGDIDPT